MSRIDPGIALQVRPPQINDPMDTYAKVLGLKNIMQQGRLNEQSLQLGQEQIRSTNLKNQEEERQMKADQALRDAIQQNVKIGDDGSFSIDHPRVEATIVRAGYPEKALAYNKARLEIENGVLDHVTKELDVNSKKSKKLGEMAATILNAPEELRPAIYSFTLKQAVSGGLVDQKTLQEKGIPMQYNGKDTDAMLQQLADLGTEDPYGQQLKRMTEKRAQAEEQRKADAEVRTAKTYKAELPGKVAEATEKQLKLESQLLGAAKTQQDWLSALDQIPEDRQKNYPTQFSEEARQKAAMLGVDANTRAQMDKFTSPTEMAYAARRGDKDAAGALKDLESREIRIESAKKMAEYNMFFGPGAVAGAGGAPSAAGVPAGETPLGKLNEDYLKTINPATAAQVRALTEGRMQFPSGMSLRSPYWQAMIAAVAKYDPDFDQTNYNNRAKMRTDFASGPAAQGINALGTTAQHLNRLAKSIDGLGNWEGIPIFNKTANSVKNWLKEQGGDTTALNKFRDDVQAVTSEAVRAWRQAGGSEKDIQDWKKNVDSSDSPSGLKSSLAEISDLLEGKLIQYQRQWKQGMGPTADANAPNAIKILGETRNSLATLRGEKPDVDNGKYGDPRITEEIMAKARKANPGVPDDVLANAIKGKLK